MVKLVEDQMITPRQFKKDLKLSLTKPCLLFNIMIPSTNLGRFVHVLCFIVSVCYGAHSAVLISVCRLMHVER